MSLDLAALSTKIAYDRFLEVYKKWDKEQMEKDKIRFSDAFIKKKREADLLTAEMEEMLGELPDSSKELEEAKKVLQYQLSSQNLSNYENVRLKFGKSKSVDKAELLKVIDGDMDLFITLSGVTQKALIEHATGAANERELLSCIKTTEVPTDVEILDPLASK